MINVSIYHWTLGNWRKLLTEIDTAKFTFYHNYEKYTEWYFYEILFINHLYTNWFILVKNDYAEYIWIDLLNQTGHQVSILYWRTYLNWKESILNEDIKQKNHSLDSSNDFIDDPPK